MRAFYFFLLSLIAAITLIDAIPVNGRIRSFFGIKKNKNQTVTPNKLTSSTPNISQTGSKHAGVRTIGEGDHKTFTSQIQSVKNSAVNDANYHLATGNQAAAVPHQRTQAYMNHNQNVVNSTPVGGKITLSHSESGRHVVYHPAQR